MGILQIYARLVLHDILGDGEGMLWPVESTCVLWAWIECRGEGLRSPACSQMNDQCKFNTNVMTCNFRALSNFLQIYVRLCKFKCSDIALSFWLAKLIYRKC